MSVKALVDFFNKCERAPTPLADIRDQILSITGIEHIDFIPFAENTGDLLGMLVRWTQPHVYGSVAEHCAVCYNENQPPWLQRVVCCKEMLNIFDSTQGVTKTREDVNGLLDGLLGHRQDDYTLTNLFDLQKFFDEKTVAQAMAVLYPINYLLDRKREIDDGSVNFEGVAAKLFIPVDFVKFLLSPGWLDSALKIVGF